MRTREDLRAHVNWRSDDGARDHGGCLAEAEVTNFRPVIAVQQNVLQFDVSVRGEIRGKSEEKDEMVLIIGQRIQNSRVLGFESQNIFESPNGNYLCISP